MESIGRTIRLLHLSPHTDNHEHPLHWLYVHRPHALQKAIIPLITANHLVLCGRVYDLGIYISLFANTTIIS